jgi:hypothetical protein
MEIYFINRPSQGIIGAAIQLIEPIKPLPAILTTAVELQAIIINLHRPTININAGNIYVERFIDVHHFTAGHTGKMLMIIDAGLEP